MKQAFILEDCDDPLLARPQLWFNMQESWVIELLSDHPFEKDFAIFFHIIPLMPVHIDAFFQSCPPPS